MSICLAMVCKNEAKYIREALKSVKPFVTHWSIMDTGSTDGTQDIVAEELTGIPGQLHQREWKDYGTSRTECLELAQQSGADHIFILDADEIVSGKMPELTEDRVQWATIQFGPSLRYKRPNILPAKAVWKYFGVTHEYLSIPAGLTSVDCDIVITTAPERATKSGERCLEDARLLEKALKTEPENSRYVFYLAQSYKDAGESFKALEMYQARAAMGGWVEEIWYSLFMAARLMAALNYAEIDVTEAYVRAYEANPERAESLGELAHYLQVRQKRALAYRFSVMAKDTGPTDQKLFVDSSFADWRNLDEYAVACYWMGLYKESIQANMALLKSGKLPEGERGRIENNAKFSLRKIGV